MTDTLNIELTLQRVRTLQAAKDAEIAVLTAKLAAVEAECALARRQGRAVKVNDIRKAMA